MASRPIRRRKLYEEVVERLMERIREGETAPGAQLPSEHELMELYGVGRPAVREALQALERSGVITINHGERARVALPTAEALVAQLTRGAELLLRMDPGSLEHLKQVRVLLETGMARLAAEKAGPEELAILRRCLDEQRRHVEDPRRFVDSDMHFHTQIAVMSGNPIFPVISEALLGWLKTYYRSLVRAPGAESLTLQEHERIFEAIARRDAPGAEAAMSDHLMRANALYRRLAEPRPLAQDPPPTK